MTATLYAIPLSHPVHTARLLLAAAEIPHETRMLLAGAHPLMLRAAGFRSSTVPALKTADGRRATSSRAIAQLVHELRPDAGIYPADPTQRARVEEAERWGEEVLQPVPRRLIRRGLSDSHSVRRWFADEATPFPAPGATAVALAPVSRLFAQLAGASREVTTRDRAEVDEHLTRVDELLAEGPLGGDRPTAADCQIAPSVRMLGAFASLRDTVAAHPASDAWSRRLVPDYPDVPV
jgi:glutathione S-transferase